MQRDFINDDCIRLYHRECGKWLWNLTFSFISSFLALFRMLFALQEQIIFLFSTSPKTTRCHDCRLLILLQSSKVIKGQGWLVMMINVIQNAVLHIGLWDERRKANGINISSVEAGDGLQMQRPFTRQWPTVIFCCSWNFQQQKNHQSSMTGNGWKLVLVMAYAKLAKGWQKVIKNFE